MTGGHVRSYNKPEDDASEQSSWIVCGPGPCPARGRCIVKGHSVHLQFPHFHPRMSRPTFSALMIVVWTAITILLAALLVMATAGSLAPRTAQPKAQDLTRYSGPALSEIIARGTALDLDDSQYAALGRLEWAWSLEERKLERELAAAERAAFERWRSVRGESGVSVASIVYSGRGYDDVAAEYAVRRARYWKQGLAVLNASQRAAFVPAGEPAY